MKKLTLILMIFIAGKINAQTDSALTFELKEFKISFTQIYHLRYQDRVENQFVTTDIEGNNSLQFLNDSVVRVSEQAGIFNDLSINSIDKISFKTGKNHILNGALIGTGAGTILGLGIGALIASGIHSQGGFLDLSGVDRAATIIVSTGTGFLIGGIIGLIVGANTGIYKDYDLKNLEAGNKKAQLLKIARKHKSWTFKD